jgi:hypothetical protein
MINIYFKFLKKLDKIYNDPKIKLKSFQIKLMLELFMCLMLDLSKSLLSFYSLRVTIIF